MKHQTWIRLATNLSSAAVIVIGAFEIDDMDLGVPGIMVFGLVVLFIGWLTGQLDQNVWTGKGASKKDDE